MVQEFRLPADLVVRQLVGVVRAGDQVLVDSIGARGMRRSTVLVEAARPKALRPCVVHHEIRRDVPGQVSAALEAGLGVVQILRVEIVIAGETSGGRRPALVAAETAADAALRGVVEVEIPRADRERQHLRYQVVVDRGEESQLLRVARGVLREGGVVALNTGIRHRRPGCRAYVRKAAAIARSARRAVRRTRRHGLVQPAGLVE